MPTFPRAKYVVSEVEFETFSDHDHVGIADVSVEPLVSAGCLTPVASDHRITEHIALLSTEGHSPGHVSVEIVSNGERALITGDMVHTPIQFLRPEISADRFDFDVEQAISTRRTIIDRIADGTTRVLGTHFPPPTAGHVFRSADGNISYFPHLESERSP